MASVCTCLRNVVTLHEYKDYGDLKELQNWKQSAQLMYGLFLS